MLRAYKYAIYPTDAQKEQLSRFFGCVRVVYNLGLETKIRAWSSSYKSLNYFDLNKQLPELKSEFEWLKDCPSQALQMTLRNLDNAYTQFFKGAGFPKFKNKYSKQSIQFPQWVSVDFDKSIITIPHLKKVSCLFHRTFHGTIKTSTITKTPTGKYFVSILVENQDNIPTKKPVSVDTSVGIDMGVKTFATLSDGTSFANNQFLRRNLARLRVEQRKLSRRFKKGAKEQSKGYQRQKLVVAKLHERIRNQREDFLHKVSTQIIRNYNTVCLEDLNIKGMVKNHNLALSIQDVGWHKFKTFLEYKAEWYGKNILYIGRFDPSSKICSTCGNIFKELKLSDRVWSCSSCGTTHDRDANAAKNIKNFGLRNQPSTVNVSH